MIELILYRVYSSPIVTFDIGNPPTQFSVHRDVLHNMSQRMNDWTFDAPNPKRIMPLRDIETGTFTAFLCWLYHGEVYAPESETILSLCKLWLLADRVQVYNGILVTLRR